MFSLTLLRTLLFVLFIFTNNIRSSRVFRLEKRLNILEQKMFQDSITFREDIEMIREMLLYNITCSSKDSLEREMDNKNTNVNEEISTKVDITLGIVTKAMTEEKGYIRAVLNQMRKDIEGIRKECIDDDNKILEELKATTINYEQLRSNIFVQSSELQKTKQQLEHVNKMVGFYTNTSKQLKDKIENEITSLRQELHKEKESFSLKIQKLEEEMNILTVRQCSDPSWTSFGTSCYHVGKDSLTWNEAKLKCESYGGKLVEVDSYSTNSFLVSLAKQKGVGGNGVWLGATDQKTEGTWIWSSDERRLVFSNFRGGEPNGRSGENCLHLYRQANWAWNDTNCNGKMGYICEIERV